MTLLVSEMDAEVFAYFVRVPAPDEEQEAD